MESIVIDHEGNISAIYNGMKYGTISSEKNHNKHHARQISFLNLVNSVELNELELIVDYGKFGNQRTCKLSPWNEEIEKIMNNAVENQIAASMRLEGNRLVFEYKNRKYSTIQDDIYLYDHILKNVVNKKIMYDGLCIEINGYCFYMIETDN